MSQVETAIVTKYGEASEPACLKRFEHRRSAIPQLSALTSHNYSTKRRVGFKSPMDLRDLTRNSRTSNAILIALAAILYSSAEEGDRECAYVLPLNSVSRAQRTWGIWHDIRALPMQCNAIPV